MIQDFQSTFAGFLDVFGLSLSFMIVNETSVGFGPLVGQIKQFVDATSGSGKLSSTFFTF